jgi:hypothetical protein
MRSSFRFGEHVTKMRVEELDEDLRDYAETGRGRPFPNNART